MDIDTEDRLERLTRKRLRADLRTGTKWQKRRAADRRAHRDRLDGSAGAASPCVRLDPATLEPIAEFTPSIAADGIITGLPVIGAPLLGVIWRCCPHCHRVLDAPPFDPAELIAALADVFSGEIFGGRQAITAAATNPRCGPF